MTPITPDTTHLACPPDGGTVPVSEASVFFSRGASLLSTAIRAVCYRPSSLAWRHTPTHCGFLFRIAKGVECVHEALFTEGWTVKPASKLWAFSRRRGCAVWSYRLPVSERALQRLFTLSSRAVGTRIGYDWGDLLKLLIVERSVIGKWFSVAESPRRWYCAEGVARLLYAATRWDVRDARRTTFASVTPASVMIRLREIVAGKV